MAKKKLSDANMKEMTDMVTQGKTPEEISRHFNIAVSSVHNYKRELKKKGVDIPDIKGKRPGDPYQRKPVRVIAQGNTPVKKDTTLSSYITVNINHCVFRVDSQAKEVTIGQDSLTVRF